MKKKFILIFIVIFSLSSCGYSPIYYNTDIKTFKFNILKLTGDEEMNNIINLEFEKFSDQNATNTLGLNIITEYGRNILSKNKEGKATSYSLYSQIKFEVINNKESQIFIFDEEIKTENMNNEFELREYEKTLKNNFIKSKITELILQLSIENK